MRRIAVGDVMTQNLISVGPVDSLDKCARKMVRERVDNLLVVDGARLVGILTARDVLGVVMKNPKDLRSIRAFDVATRKVAVIKPSADISQAMNKMRALNFRRLPVISQGELLGVITLKDILAIEPAFYSEVGDLLDVREVGRKKEVVRDDWLLEGLCENCGAFSDLLKVQGQLLCPDCRDEIY